MHEKFILIILYAIFSVVFFFRLPVFEKVTVNPRSDKIVQQQLQN